MSRLTRDDVQRGGRVTREVEVESWGGSVEIRAMSVLESREHSEGERGDGFGAMAKVVQKCVVDPAFETVEEVMDMPFAGVQFLFWEILVMTGLSRMDDEDGDDEDAPGPIEAAEGNSEPTPSSGSTTG